MPYSRNTFVLEYCGEVLDHKEFKTRVKEYARNKNIHYYFMSLKNNEVSGDQMLLNVDFSIYFCSFAAANCTLCFVTSDH